MPLASVRGAATCPANRPEAILETTRDLVRALQQENPGLTPGSTLVMIFTSTPDLDAAFPAAAARELGFTETALLGAKEAGVPGAPARCIRVLALYELTAGGTPGRVHHGVPVYLGDARRLRPDLAGHVPAPTPAGPEPEPEAGSRGRPAKDGEKGDHHHEADRDPA
jgi:chorismate mutase